MGNEGNCDGDGVRTICLEIVRAGPAHNQLLSPLTRYLALCGDAHAGEVTVEYEHAEFIRRLRELRYHEGNAPERHNEAAQNRQAALLELSRSMSRFLASVPGLRGQMHPRSCSDELVHLQIVVTAAELAMLPLEMSGTLESGGNEPGNFMLLNPSPRVSMTRRVRSVSESCVEWPDTPRILFISASPERAVPFDEHKDALLRCLQRWLPPLATINQEDEEATKRYRKALNAQLTIIEHADIDQIAQACARDAFTHIHVLAHGAPDPSSPGRHFGIALHSVDRPDEAHVVSGAQFATAIRRDGGRRGATVVTVAACDSGNVSDVLYTGASFLHDLHRAGIPLVVGSQFPLSVPGSEEFCEQLYEGLLLGKEPRQLLADLRLRLHALYASKTHDWASVVAYAVFPPEFEDQLDKLKYKAARRAVNVALDYLDRQVDSITKAEMSATVDATKIKQKVDSLAERALKAAELMPTKGQFITEGLGVIAASRKRTAEAWFRAALKLASQDRKPLFTKSMDLLDKSWDRYAAGFREGVRFRNEWTRAVAPLHWALTQQLSLNAVLEKDPLPDLFATAQTIALNDLSNENREAQVWALTSLMELALLAWWEKPDAPEAAANLIRYTDRLLKLVPDEDTSAVYSTRRQFWRYLSWWWTPDFANALKERTSQESRPTVGDQPKDAVAWPTASDPLKDAVRNVVLRLDEHLSTHEAPVSRQR